MEKISSILSGSPRVTSVDMKESSPVRSGTPGFGRAEAHVSRERPSTDSLKQATDAHAEVHDWRSKDVKHAAIAKEMSNRFFAKNKVDIEEIPQPSEGRLAAFTAAAEYKVSSAQEMLDENEAMHSDIQAGITNPEARSQPAGLHPKGSFINYVA